LVGEPNRGLEYMFTMMNHARLNVGLEGMAVSEAAYQHAVAYARARVQGKPIGGAERDPIIHHPDVRRMLMDMRARTEAMRALAYSTAACMDRARHHPDPAVRAHNQGRVELLTPVVKGWCTESSILIASTGIQVHGGMGYVEETGAAQYLRDARITTIYEGTTGIQANDLLGRKLVRDKGLNAGALIRDMTAELDALALTNDADLSAIASAFRAALGAFEEATAWLLARYDSNPREAAAGAVPYLKLTGIVVGGWQMARAARIARELLSAGEENTAFLHAKIATARFYAEHVLPEATGARDEITAGAGSTLALEEMSF
jgi:3-(methylthio)propanoyl-CoA dehydrogenase